MPHRSLLQQNIKNKWLTVLAGMAVGGLVFLLLYGTAPLHVGLDGWILNGYDETDVQQHYAGWLLFRNSHWAFPLGLCGNLAAPDGTLISYTDSLPWLSIGLKLLRGLLPATFQWFGLYIFFCFMMQGAAGALLAGRAFELRCLPFAALGGALFACAPVLWERSFRHVALGSHYLYLFALYFYLEYRTALAGGAKQPAGPARPRYPWQFALLGFAAVGIHPYFLPPVLLCALLAAASLWHTGRQPAKAVLGLAGALAATVVGGVLSGAIGGGVAVSREGYGEVSMNLNALFNPRSRGGYTWSRLLPVLPQQPAQYDGFNYLGLGVLALVAAAGLYAAYTLRTAAGRAAAKAWWRRNAPLAAGCGLLTVFAVSNHVYFGMAGFSYPLPSWLENLCGIFRSSGRMFYLPGACLVLFGLYTLRAACQNGKLHGYQAGKALACGLLCAVLALQGWDLSAVAAEKRAMFQKEIDATVVNAPETQTLGTGHTKLIAAGPLREDRTRLLAVLAGKQGLATNISIAVSGSYPGAEQAAADAAAQLAAGRYDPATVYVTTDGGQYDGWQETFGTDPGVTLFVASSCYFLVPTG